MPPKNECNVVDTESGTGKRIKKKNKDGCPSKIRKTDRIVLNRQARDIVFKIYEFMKYEAMNNYAEKLTNARWRTATAAGVSEKTVSRILKEKRKRAGAVKNIDNAVGAASKGDVGDAMSEAGTLNRDSANKEEGAVSNG